MGNKKIVILEIMFQSIYHILIHFLCKTSLQEGKKERRIQLLFPLEIEQYVEINLISFQCRYVNSELLAKDGGSHVCTSY